MTQRLITQLALFFIYAASAFCLWGIGTALIAPPWQALLLFPFGLRMGILLQSPYRFWPGILLADLLLMALLADQFGYGPALWASVAVLVLTVLLSLLASPWLLRHQQSDSEWRWPLLQGAVVAIAALLQALVWQLVSGEGARALLLGLTGGFTIAPTCLLLWHYLARQIWVPLEPGLIHKPVELRLGHLASYLLLFAFSIWLQQQVNAAELRRFAPFCLAIPIVFMSYRYGWQGALLATLLNGVALMVNEPPQPESHRDLLLSLLAQSLTGLLLGAGIQRQRELNQQLRLRLAENRQLARALVTAEEQTRREVARELHDEIGQNITAIQIQSQLVKRARDPAQTQAAANQIADLARRIHHSTRQLLRQLRPPALDELAFKDALHHLLNEFAFSERGIRCRFDYRLIDTPAGETVRFTLYRLLQELLNNVCKHAEASEVAIVLYQQGALLHLEVRDNGIGIRADKAPGLGIQGMRERVSALGGELTLDTQRGTRVIVNLPTNLQQTAD
ncbi:signal transduction histidine-protein kinase/phosphatase UhpB [Serratia marcescens]|uniref:signal transduction histidine-protein kinase/phosphatase UhpB n=1 Tax=Serratia marcescens TaxID=615 RepID=UPI000F7F3DB6|nr:signal transduction histidine-protein kinase/phosphatase UhpB [Serratia marcescens]RTF89151.1 signal transduction histidine-protein kinase/phosphatase UhpB [Serratia marcescens]RTF98179.1 signal transduction histidine-protein kinase/phosphatase UhpB [Serratia marcescens]